MSCAVIIPGAASLIVTLFLLFLDVKSMIGGARSNAHIFNMLHCIRDCDDMVFEHSVNLTDRNPFYFSVVHPIPSCPGKCLTQNFATYIQYNIFSPFMQLLLS